MVEIYQIRAWIKIKKLFYQIENRQFREASQNTPNKNREKHKNIWVIDISLFL